MSPEERERWIVAAMHPLRRAVDDVEVLLRELLAAGAVVPRRITPAEMVGILRGTSEACEPVTPRRRPWWRPW